MLDDYANVSAPQAFQGLDGAMPAPLRDPHELFEATLRGWNPREDLWVFGYASLIWRPEFDADEQRLARVHGYHRALRMRSRVNRGTPQTPGLVFALLSGGSCQGMAFRVPRANADRELRRLWQREMPTGVYDPRWLHCRTAQGPVKALAFTLSRGSPNYTGEIADEEMLAILREARGRYGTTLEYLLATATGLRECGICDAEIERLAALARQHGLA
ncbi:MAG TPA: gamma-glutamylcyclotransferase [Methylibium sp.]